MTCQDIRNLNCPATKNLSCLATRNQCMMNMKSTKSLFMRSMKNQSTKNMKKPSLVMRSPWRPMNQLLRRHPFLLLRLHWTLVISLLLALADVARLKHPEGLLQVASAGPKCWWRFHPHPLLLTNLVEEVEEERAMEQEVDVEQEEAREMEEAGEMEEVMDAEVELVQEDLVALEVLLVESAEQVLQVQMAIVHGMVPGDVTGMVEEGEGEAGTEVWDLLDLTTTQPGMDPEEEVEAVDVAEVGVKDQVDQLEELVE